MMNKSPRIIGWILIGLGLIIIIDKVFHVSVWYLIWPLVFIGLGIWLLMKSKQKEYDTVTQKIIGDINREGIWQVTNEEILLGIGDVNLDLTRADIPEGEARIQITGLIGDIDFTLPQDIGIVVTTQGLVTDIKILGNHKENFFSSTKTVSKNFTSSKKRLIIKISLLIGDISLQRKDN